MSSVLRCGPSSAFPCPPQAAAQDHTSSPPLNLRPAYFSGFGSDPALPQPQSRNGANGGDNAEFANAERWDPVWTNATAARSMMYKHKIIHFGDHAGRDEAAMSDVTCRDGRRTQKIPERIDTRINRCHIQGPRESGQRRIAGSSQWACPICGKRPEQDSCRYSTHSNYSTTKRKPQ